MIKIENEAVIRFLKRFEENGYEAYIVGGAIRDLLLKKPVNDYDVSTNASPDEIKVLFRDSNIIETGIKHGTVTVLFDGCQIETTTFRTETEYIHNRFPSQVSFSKSFREDVSRRDFTINSMGYSLSAGLVDYFGGNEDLKRKIIKTVGDPFERFSEDALRILRALRFSSVLSFEIDKETAEAIHRCKQLLNNISAERILSELLKITGGENGFRIFKEYFDVFETVIPELSFLEEYTAMIDYVSEVSRLSHDKNDYQRLASILFPLNDISEKLPAESIDRLKPSNDLKKKTIDLINSRNIVLPERRTDLKYFLNRYGDSFLFEIITFKKSLSTAKKNYSEEERLDGIAQTVHHIIGNNECYSLDQLNVDGHDLVEMGIDPKEIGHILRSLLDLVIEEKIINRKDVLLKTIKEKGLI